MTSRKNKIFIIFIVLGIIGASVILICLWGFFEYAKFLDRAKMAEAKVTLASVYTAEKSFYKEYGHYSSQFGAIGYTPEGKLRYKYYLSEDNMPLDLIKKLKPEDRPFVTKEDFQAIAINDEDGKLSGFKINAAKSLKPLEVH